MNLTPELERFVQEKVVAGLHASQSEVVREALRLLIEQDRLRELHQQRLQAALAEGLAQAERGELIDAETVIAELRERDAADDRSRRRKRSKQG